MQIDVNQRKTALVSVESGVTALGFRRIAAVARQINPATDIYFIPVDNLYSLLSHFYPEKKEGFSEGDAEVVGKALSAYDLVCFSTMTPSYVFVESIIKNIRKYNEKCFILLGGVHAIIYPQEAIKVADGICIGEGERPFEKFYRDFLSGNEFIQTPGMSFNVGGRYYENERLKLNTNEELSSFPISYNKLDCHVYDSRIGGFRQFTKFDYLRYNGLAFRTVWTLGCPFSCRFCANDSFISMDKGYAKLRYSEPEYIIAEIKEAIAVHPYISTVAFYDDNLIALPLEVIKKFSELYHKEIGLPFVVFGVHPNICKSDKLDILAKVGMNRCRMGIQSGSEKILSLYNRNTSLKRIENSAAMLAEMAKNYNMIPPAFDIITDNPFERKEDVVETLRLIYNLKRPFTLTVFSLRVFPKTGLWEYFEKFGMDFLTLNNSSYLSTRPSIGNILIYIIATFKPPKKLFEFSLKFVRGNNEKQKNYYLLYYIVRVFYLGKRAFDHIVRFDFTTITGAWLYYLYKIRRYCTGKMRRVRND
jgi:radical SAM superfamily enzyme YgiQ (UPF0313 family)